jgi:acyl-CoA thioester hydrolase
MEVKPCIHKVQYYETDRMGITHHSNYIRIMEEARIDFLAQLGYEYAKLEAMGVVSPVTKVECQYKVPTTFADEIRVFILVEECSFARLRLRYKMLNQNSVVVCTAASEHCFVSPEGKIIRIDREFPEFFETLKEQSEANSL